ncbi:Ig-like domain-containing protein [Nocardioides humi]|nr:Ig-like domain-containing protein [Nocardioides humi]
MNHRTFPWRAAAAGTALALAASPLLGISSPAHAEDPAPTDYPEPTHGATIDWFSAAFDDVGPDSVFESATLERFEYLLRKPAGKYAFLIGGAEDDYLQQTIGLIDDAARAAGIDQVLVFDPALDGDTLNIFDTSGLPLDQAGKDFVNQYGTRLVQNYLGKDAETPFELTAPGDPDFADKKVEDGYPYLFVYDAAGGDTNRIVAGLSERKTAADLDTPAEVDAFKAEVTGVLTATALTDDTQWDFLAGEHNRRHAARYPNQLTHGGPVFSEEEDLPNVGTAGEPVYDKSDFRLQSITYPELQYLLDQPGDFAILFGGTWCHNTAAIVEQTEKYARQYGIKKVYAFDFVLNTNDQTQSNGSGNYLHIRDNALVSGQPRRASYLYGSILEKLSNATTQYKVTAGEPGTQSVNPVRYYTGGDTGGTERLARKIQVGHLLSYNKDHEAGGESAPVTDQAIRDSRIANPETGAETGNLEYMTEVWWTQGAELPFDPADPDRLRGGQAVGNPPTQNGINQVLNQRAFAREGLLEVRDVIAGVAGGYDSEVSATGAPESVPASDPGAIEVTAGVESDFDGWYSLNGIGGTATPASDEVPLDGTVELYVDDTLIDEAEVGADRTATLSGELPELTQGTHELRYVYSGGNGGLVKGAEHTASLHVVAESSTTTLEAPTTLGFGQGGAATATVTEGASGDVTLNGLPGGPLTVTLASGEATFEIPASLPAGGYELTASYAGDDTYASSVSAPVELTVGKALTIAQAAPVTTTYGQGGALSVTLSSPSGTVTGDVTLTGVGAAQTRPLAGGTATFTVPKDLAVGQYSAKLAFAGDANLNGSQTQVAYTVNPAAPSAVAGKVKKAPTSKKAGKVKVTVAAPAGAAPASGKVKLVLKKGSVKNKVTATLSNGAIKVSVPKLAKGTWQLTVKYVGDSNYTAADSATVKVKVKR